MAVMYNYAAKKQKKDWLILNTNFEINNKKQTKDWLILSTTFKINNSARSLFVIWWVLKKPFFSVLLDHP